MTQETEQLKERIDQIKTEQNVENQVHLGKPGYNATLNILTDLFGCVLVGLGLGVFSQMLFDTSVLLTGALTILGGVAGLWTVVRYGLAIGKREDEERLKEDKK